MEQENTAQRLQETAAKCLSSLEAWNKDLKNNSARESLLEAVHELRKVTSRLEIDIAMNDRQAINSRPIPIPKHKSKMEKEGQKPLSEILPVAELKEESKKRKIAIEETKNNNPGADNNEHENNTSDVKDTEENTEKKTRRPRRKKAEE